MTPLSPAPSMKATLMRPLVTSSDPASALASPEKSQ